MNQAHRQADAQAFASAHGQAVAQAKFNQRVRDLKVINNLSLSAAETVPLTAKPPTVIHRCNFSLGCAELEFASQPQKACIPTMNIFKKNEK